MMRRQVCALCVAVLVTCASWSAIAGDKEEAKQLFDAGLKLTHLDDFAGASANFERSVALYPTQNSIFNLANCYKALQRYGDALAVIERLKRDFAGKLKPEIKEAVERQQQDIQSLVARLTLRTVPVDATIKIDGKDFGQGPTLGPLLLGPGEHEIEATRPGHRSERRSVKLVSGVERTEKFVLKVDAQPEPAQPACPYGQEITADTKGHCCFAGQVWNGKCVGVPTSCPDGHIAVPDQQRCELAACKEGMVRADDQLHCCWPGQGWSASRKQCVGVPTSCPEEYRPDSASQACVFDSFHVSADGLISADGLTVTDKKTGLVWQHDGSGTRTGCSGEDKLTCTWNEAMAYCAALTLGSLSDWRLPTKAELGSIVDRARKNPSINPIAFSTTPAEWFWTSSPHDGSSGFVWVVDFYDGDSNVNAVGNHDRVRCVR